MEITEDLLASRGGLRGGDPPFRPAATAAAAAVESVTATQSSADELEGVKTAETCLFICDGNKRKEESNKAKQLCQSGAEYNVPNLKLCYFSRKQKKDGH